MKSTKKNLMGVVILLAILVIVVLANNLNSEDEASEESKMQIPEGMQNGNWSDRMPPENMGNFSGELPEGGMHMFDTESCEGLSEGDFCEMESPRGDIMTGICQTFEDTLICMPEMQDKMRFDGQMPPSPEIMN